MRAFIEGDSQESNKCLQDHQLLGLRKHVFPGLLLQQNQPTHSKREKKERKKQTKHKTA